jgi:hypothetical protein
MIKFFLRQVFLLLTLVFFTSQLQAQDDTGEDEANSAELSAEEIGKYKQDCEQLVRYLEYTLNSLGGEDYTTAEKDVMITKSYAKIFANDKIQIEDDLDETRMVSINKDVQAYLKDIDFFFKEVSFEFNIDEITHHFTSEEQIYFKVSLNRHIEGIDLENKKISNSQERFIEINLNHAKKELKIVSIYTTKLSENEDLAFWWNELSPQWKNFFAESVSINDSLTMKNILAISDTLRVYDNVLWGMGDTLAINTPLLFVQLKNLLNMETLNLAKNIDITDLEALGKFKNLKELDISNTLISDLSPLRNHTKLEYLHIPNTKITDLSPLKYAIHLKVLHIHNTEISDLSVLKNFTKLEKLHTQQTQVEDLTPLLELTALRTLDCSDTKIKTLAPLANLKKLNFLRASNTQITTLKPLADLVELERLHIDKTTITSLEGLEKLPNLRVLLCNETKIKDLDAIGDLAKLETVYCDNSGITASVANKFMKNHTKTLIIYESKALQSWWTSLSNEWKRFFTQQIEAGKKPTKIELQKMVNLEKIDLSKSPLIRTLEPLKMLINLKELDAPSSKVSDLSPLSDLIDLQNINLKRTQVTDINPLRGLTSLEVLNIENTKVQNLLALNDLSTLKFVYADFTGVNAAKAKAFYQKHPYALLTYQTSQLRVWFTRLPAQWKEVFHATVKLDKLPNKEQLHRLAHVKSIKIIDKSSIRDLSALKMLSELTELEFSNTQVSDLQPLTALKNLAILKCPRNPIATLHALKEMPSLKELDIENTPVVNFDPFEYATKLEIVNCSGTELKSLKPFSNLKNIREISIFSTKVRTLKYIEDLPKLSLVKCYNSNLNNKKVNAFRSSHPKCEVVYY